MSIVRGKVPSKLLAAVAATTLVVTPVIVFADASAPWVNKTVKKRPAAKKVAPRKRARPVARSQAPAPAPVVEQVQAPVYEAPAPVPPPEPMPVAEAPPPPAPPAPPPVAPVAESKGNGLLYALLGVAGVAGAIAVASSGGESASSP